MENAIRGVLFDLDGTLVDTIPDITSAVNSALEEAGLAPLTYGQVKTVVGKGLRNALQGALALRGRTVSDARLDMLLHTLMEHYQAHPADHSKPYHGIEALLHRLAADNIPMGVLSNKADSLTETIVGMLFPDIPFVSVEGMRTDRPRKPDPQGIFRFSSSAGVPVRNILYVGDSEVDWQTTLKAPEVQAAIVTWGFRSREALQAGGARPLLDTIDELEAKIYGID
ncbi:MAG: HAD family hydrolase [Sphaerochaetaceae bacterium]|jgi:phosphoglycolate phosphatase